MYHTFGADLKTLSIYRKTTSQSDRGTVSASWALSHSLPSVDVQPVASEVRRQMEGDRETIQYVCYVAGGAPSLQNGDRVIDPLTSDTIPTLEVFDVEKWMAASGLPGHTRFYLRKVQA